MMTTVAKSKVQMQLIEVEEENFACRRLFSTSRSNQIKFKKLPRENYELVTKQLQAENDILELEMKATKKQEGVANMQKEVERLMQDRELAQEFATLKTNFVELQEKKARCASN